MNGDPPANMELVDPQARHYPPSWRDAAIRAGYEQRGVLCKSCGTFFQGRRELVLLECDHVHPWSRGGLTTWENLQLLCRPCNNRKSNAIPSVPSP